MRQLMMFNRVSADGYFATNEGHLDWVVPDDAIDRAGASRMHELDTMLFGRHTEHGLIDEYQFVVSPLFLGGGRSLISGLRQRVKLELVEAKPYPSGNLMLRYARQR